MSITKEKTYVVPERGSKPEEVITINQVDVPHLAAGLLYRDLDSHSDAYLALMSSGQLAEINTAELAFDELLDAFPHIALGIIGYGFKMSTGSAHEMKEAKEEAIKMINYQKDLKDTLDNYPHTMTIYQSLSA